ERKHDRRGDPQCERTHQATTRALLLREGRIERRAVGGITTRHVPNEVPRLRAALQCERRGDGSGELARGERMSATVRNDPKAMILSCGCASPRAAAGDSVVVAWHSMHGASARAAASLALRSPALDWSVRVPAPTPAARSRSAIHAALAARCPGRSVTNQRSKRFFNAVTIPSTSLSRITPKTAYVRPLPPI